MRIVVCLAPIPADAAPTSLSAYDAHAVEAALQIAEQRRAHRTAVEVAAGALAPPEALGAVRGALAMGAGRASLVVHPPGLADDVVAQAETMAEWLRDQRPDLVLSCPWSGDIAGTVFLTALGELTGLRVLTGARRLAVDDEGVEIERQTESGDETVRAPLPCVVEVGETINQARYPTVKGRARAQQLPIDLVRAPTVPTVRVTAGPAVPLPGERATLVVDDPAGAVGAIVDFLGRQGAV